MNDSLFVSLCSCLWVWWTLWPHLWPLCLPPWHFIAGMVPLQTFYAEFMQRSAIPSTLAFSSCCRIIRFLYLLSFFLTHHWYFCFFVVVFLLFFFRWRYVAITWLIFLSIKCTVSISLFSFYLFTSLLLTWIRKKSVSNGDIKLVLVYDEDKTAHVFDHKKTESHRQWRFL